MSQNVTVHSKKPCVQCDATFRRLDKDGIEYDVVQLTDESAAKFRDAGHMQAPVVVTDTDTWAGFRPDLIDKLKEIAA